MTDETEFPGYRRTRDALQIWVDSLAAQGKRWNNAWREMLGGKYGVGSLMRDLSGSYQDQSRVVERFWGSVSGNASPQVPSWLRLDLANKFLSGVVQTREFDLATANLQCTSLVSLNASDTHFEMNLEVVSSTQIRVSITRFHDAKQPAVELPGGLDAVRNAAKAGIYLGMLFDQRGGTEAPLAIVSLTA